MNIGDKLTVEAFFDPNTWTISYLVLDRDTRCCALIDSVLDYDPKSGRTRTESADRLLTRVRELDARVEWILETHVHADHLSAAAYLKEQLGAKVAIGSHITEVQQVFGELFNEGNAFRRDGSQFDVLLADNGELPQTRLFMCHDYLPDGRELQYMTTVAEQRARNIHVHEGIDEDTFVSMREARDATLDMPVLMLPSVQVNMRSGQLPEPEDNGVRYLKIPLNAL